MASKYSLVMSSCFPLLQRYTHKFNNKQKQKLSLVLCPRLNKNLSLGKKTLLNRQRHISFKLVVLFCWLSIEERYFRIIYHNLLGWNSLPPSRHALSRKKTPHLGSFHIQHWRQFDRILTASFLELSGCTPGQKVSTSCIPCSVFKYKVFRQTHTQSRTSYQKIGGSSSLKNAQIFSIKTI